MAGTTGDKWADAITMLTGMVMPTRDKVFADIHGNDNIPLMNVSVKTIKIKPNGQLEKANWGYGQDGHTYTLLVFTGSGSDLQAHQVAVDYLWSGNDPAPGGSTGAYLDVYFNGPWHALNALVNPPFTTKGLVYGNASGSGTVAVSDAVDLTGLSAMSIALSRTQTFFEKYEQNFKTWTDGMDSKDASWKGNGAQQFTQVLTEMTANYKSWREQLGPTGYTGSNTPIDGSPAANNRPADGLIQVQNAVHTSAQHLLAALDGWQPTYQSHILKLMDYDFMTPLLEWVNANNQHITIQTTTVKDGTQGSGDATGGGDTSTSKLHSDGQWTPNSPYGDLTQMSSWAAMGQAAITKWWGDVDISLGAPGGNEVVTVNQALNEASMLFGTGVTTPSPVPNLPDTGDDNDDGGNNNDHKPPPDIGDDGDGNDDGSGGNDDTKNPPDIKNLPDTGGDGTDGNGSGGDGSDGNGNDSTTTDTNLPNTVNLPNLPDTSGGSGLPNSQVTTSTTNTPLGTDMTDPGGTDQGGLDQGGLNQGGTDPGSSTTTTDTPLGGGPDLAGANSLLNAGGPTGNGPTGGELSPTGPLPTTTTTTDTGLNGPALPGSNLLSGDPDSSTGGVTVRNPDGSLTTSYPDGTERTVGADGTVTTTTPDGSTFTTSPDGTVTPGSVSTVTDTPLSGGTTVHNPNGTTTTTSSDGTTTTNNLDGSITTKHPDGSMVTAAPDGSETFTAPDGTVTHITPDGTETVTAPNGTVTTTTPNGGTTITSPQGTVSTVGNDGILATHHPNGSTTFTSPNGTQQTLHPDGTLTDTHKLPEATFAGGGGGGGLTHTALSGGTGGHTGSGPTIPKEAGYDLSTDFTQGDGQQGLGSTLLGGAAPAAVAGSESGGMPMGGMGGMGGMGQGQGQGESDKGRVREVIGGETGRAAPTRMRPVAATEEEGILAANRVETASGLPIGPLAPGEGQATESKDRDREHWMSEEDDVWGAEEGGSPAVIGR